ncbi:MAG: NADH-quinone oxidoreductase subunit L [Verrucomicrobiota bacterium]|nr:NADH-quinone oxidoreductase subunit L [Verrucomicrobiota bacterium]
MNFNPVWLILFLPLVSAAVIACFTIKCSSLSSLISTSSAGICALLSIILAFGGLTPPAPFHWMTIGGLNVTIGFWYNHLSQLMLLVVTVVGFLVHFYSLGYMKGDEGKSRYFAGLSLFMFSMTGIVFADNLIMMFMFWELVGVSSYVLIGHWFFKHEAADAAKKAFLTNKIGDFGFIMGIILIYVTTGTVSLTELQSQTGQLGVAVDLAVILLFCGAVGKSAQVPLHVWLPDAMEGPTPVSALMHAATMVAAGVYMLSRIFFVLTLSQTGLEVIAWVGGITCCMAGFIAIQQNDIKKILAYSTLSQVGYMVMAVGLTSPDAGMFHLTTHACFKALLFLGAGSVIIAMHHEQDIWKMGGLFKKLPVTAVTFAIGGLALAGFPLTSGFFSKDLILTVAFEHNKALWFIGTFTAFLTAFYVMRLYMVAFINKPSGDNKAAVEHAQESPWVMTMPLVILAIAAIAVGYVGVPHYLGMGGETHASKIVEIASSICVFCGLALGWFLYKDKSRDPLNITVLKKKFYWDEFYEFLVEGIQQNFARLLAFIDRWFIDGLFVSGSGIVTNVFGRATALLQTGNLQTYTITLVFGLIVLLLLMFGLAPLMNLMSGVQP